MERRNCGLIPDGLRRQRRRLLAIHKHYKVYGIQRSLTYWNSLRRTLETKDVDNFLTRETCRNPAAKGQRVVRFIFISHRLGHWRRASPVAGVNCGRGQTGC